MRGTDFYITTGAVLFHDELDRQNKLETVVCNWGKHTYVNINPSGYKILRSIALQSGISLTEISSQTKQNLPNVEKFLDHMLKENVIYSK